ncbi:MAG: 3-dehydroquinate synthase family protein [Catalinimonas sp.]
MPTHLITDCGPALAEWLAARDYSGLFVLLDENTRRDCYPRLREHLPPHGTFTVPAGEAHKTLATCETIWRFLTESRADRHALVLNVGGGVLGDMGGFCAATYKRGVDFAQVPTTLLAQVDAATGGKLGVDFMGFKNHVGVFAAPAAVFIGTDFLQTLPEREVRSGFAEVIKHALIADGHAWEELQQRPFGAFDWLPWVRHSVKIKSDIATRDPRERGERKLLNFGHTVGHAVESYFLEQPQPLLHGEAVAVGMWCEAYLSTKRTGLTGTAFGEIKSYLEATYGRVAIREADRAAIVPRTLQDKKNRAGRVLTVLLAAPGRAVWDQPLTAEELHEALAAYAATP